MTPDELNHKIWLTVAILPPVGSSHAAEKAYKELYQNIVNFGKEINNWNTPSESNHWDRQETDAVGELLRQHLIRTAAAAIKIAQFVTS